MEIQQGKDKDRNENNKNTIDSINTSIILSKIEKIQERLERIESVQENIQSEIKKSQRSIEIRQKEFQELGRRLEMHNCFITNLYLAFRNPISKLLNIANYYDTLEIEKNTQMKITNK